MNILYANTLLVFWEPSYESNLNSKLSYYRPYSRSSILTENTYIKNITTSLNYLSSVSINSFFWFTNGIDTQFFELNLNTDLLKQVIYNHTYMYTFNVSIWDVPTLLVDVVYTFILLYFIKFTKNKLKIIL
jgi:hypothetical protein